MQETINNCARAEDLVAYLYREATETEARDFERHARQCSSCHAELTAFTDVREAINDWRQHSLGTTASPGFEADRTEAFAQAKAVDKPGRSALSALRQFFSLSPAWMRAATAAAALLFCALVVIAVAYFTEQRNVVVEKQDTPLSPRETIITQDEISDHKPIRASVAGKDQPAPPQAVMADNINSRPRAGRHKPAASAPRQFARQRRQILPRAVNTPSVELQASADDYLPFTASGDEDSLPSLADLVNDDEN